MYVREGKEPKYVVQVMKHRILLLYREVCRDNREGTKDYKRRNRNPPVPETSIRTIKSREEIRTNFSLVVERELPL